MKRPVAVTALGWLFIFVGAAGLLKDLWPLVTPEAAQHLAKLQADGVADLAPAWMLRALAIVAGVGILKRREWARWLLAVWMLTHVAISFFHNATEVIAHILFFTPVFYLLFRRASADYFRRRTEASV